MQNGNSSNRLAYLDNLRSFVIFLVVVTHSNVTYSGYGGWYYREGSPDRLDLLSQFIFGIYGSFSQAWFMGLLFFLAAFFAARSLAKRGPATFVRERLFRLGIPLLIYMFVIDPFISYYLMNYGDVQVRLGAGQAYLEYIRSFRWLSATGPLWFAEALLLFSLPYAAFRALRPARKDRAAPPRNLTLVLIAIGVGLSAFCIRLYFPMGASFSNLMLGYFASYVALFLLGIHAGERKWLENIPERQGLGWFRLVLQAGLPLWGVIMMAGGATQTMTPFNGGLTWQSFAYSFWEAFVAIGFSIGIIAFFRKRLNFENAFTRLLAQNSFGIYMFHAPILIAITLLLKGWDAPLLLKHVAVFPLAFSLTLAASFLILRRIPGLRAVLK